MKARDPKAEPDPNFPPPDPDPERKPPAPSPVPEHEPEEPGPDVIQPRFRAVANLSWREANRQAERREQTMIRENKGKPQKVAKKSPDANTLKGTRGEQLLSKLQEESLKVHGDA